MFAVASHVRVGLGQQRKALFAGDREGYDGPKRRFLEWANKIQPDGPRLTLEELPGHTEIYLIDGHAMSEDDQRGAIDNIH